MYRILLALLVSIASLHAHAQSSLRPCPKSGFLKPQLMTNCVHTVELPDGNKVAMEMHDGLANGRSWTTRPDGRVMVSEWRKGYMIGPFKELLPDGSMQDWDFTADAEKYRPTFRDTLPQPWAGQSADTAGVSQSESALNSANTFPTTTPPSQPPKRVALVIGNSRYMHAGALENPQSDATAVSSAFRAAGFQTVLMKTDLTQQAMLASLREFASVADTADWAVVYYAGHGIEFGGVNYLLPIDARLEVDRDIELESIDLGKVLAAVEGAKRLRLIILDACRDNPFAAQMRRSVASRSIGRGLARVEPEPGTLVAYAAKHGETASDGAGGNSPFADALVRRIKQHPPIEVRRLFDYVRDDVLKATNRKQQPFSYGSISAEEDFYFATKP